MVRGLRNSRKGAYFFVLDAIIGILIFATTIFIISGFNAYNPTSESITQQMDLLAFDLFDTELRHIDVSSKFFLDLKLNNSLYDPYATVDEFVYQLVLSGKMANASLLVQNTTSWLGESYGINYSIEYAGVIQTIYFRNSSLTTYNDSRSNLIREKVTVLASNITTYIPPAFSTVVLWR